MMSQPEPARGGHRFTSVSDLLVRQGNFLFRWRSFVPLLLLLPAFAAFEESTVLQQKFGDQVEDIFGYFCYAVAMSGLFIRWLTVGHAGAGTSGRNTEGQKAETLNSTGMYSIVRNPLYLGNFIAMIGMLLSFKTWWLVLLGGLAYWIFIERIIAVEERFLTEKFGQLYTEWARKTPIIIPDFRLWRKAALPFSWKKVLRSEYNGVFAVGAVFFFSDFILDIFIEREPVGPWMRDDWFWIFEFIAATGGLIILRHLKKNTGLLTPAAEAEAPAQGNN